VADSDPNPSANLNANREAPFDCAQDGLSLSKAEKMEA